MGLIDRYSICTFRYQYNGIEHSDILGNDIGLTTYRVHDAALGRWWQIDPKAEYLYGLSPYNSMGNNPILHNDPEGDFFLSDKIYEFQKFISPIAYKVNVGIGSEGFHRGIESSLGLPKSLPFSYRFHSGISFYSGAYDGGACGTVRTSGREVTYFGLLNLSSTTYTSQSSDGTNTSQTTGTIALGNPFNNIKYENDYQPDLLNKLAIGFDLNDGGDRYRSAALQINSGPLSIGFNLFTGDPGLRSKDRDSQPGTGIHAGKDVYSGGNANDYRSGIAYFGFGSFRIGTNNEKNRHIIQNRFAHDFLQGGKAKHFQVLNRKNKFHWYFGSGFGSGLW